jgi:hypothetical protein
MNLNKLRIYQPGQQAQPGNEGGIADYTRSQPTAVVVGGLPAGHQPNGTVQDLLDKMLYPYLPPAFTSFQLNGQAQVLELGEGVLAGPKTFSWSTSNLDNVTPNSLSLHDLTLGQVLVSGMGNDGSEEVVIPAISKQSISQHSFSITGVNTEGHSFSRNYDLYWRPRRWAGTLAAEGLAALQAVDTASAIAAVPGLAFTLNDLNYGKPADAKYNCSVTQGGRYIWFLWDATLGQAVFTSGPAPAAFRPVQVVQLTNGFGVTRPYHLYISSNPFNGEAVPIAVL